MDFIVNNNFKFNISEIVTESLIKFMKIVLKEISDNIFNSFPDSLYLVRNEFSLKDHFYSFMV